MSDKALAFKCGLYKTLKQMIDIGYVAQSDAVMADKGFTIQEELHALGLRLNTPPRASAHRQMPGPDCHTTTAIAKHRVHVERLIGRLKKYRILSGIIPCSMFYQINKIWTVCDLLTLFQDKLIKQ